MDLPRSSPARLTALATLKLPRWALFLMCLLYTLPGLIGRDPWKTEDANGFGVMWTMAQGGSHDWLVPNIAGAPVFDNGPLAYWIGAVCIRAFSRVPANLLDAPMAARIGTILFVLITAMSLWYGTYLLGRRPAAQPLALAFGGHPEPRDYGRTLADGALLILLGTLGLAARAHESSSDVALLAMLTFALYAMARSLDRPYAGAVCMAVALAGIVLTGGPYPAAALLALWILLLVLHPDARVARLPFVLVTVPLTVGLLALWPLAMQHWDSSEAPAYFQAQKTFWMGYGDGIDMMAVRKYARNLAWFTLPGWPIALWALWSWRRAAFAAHVVLPTGYLLAIVAVLLSTSDSGDGLVLMLLPGVVMLAGFGLPTLKRGAANAIDWFSLLIYSLTAIGLWLSWATRMTGFPATYEHTMARLVPGFSPRFHWLPVLFALALSAAWVALVRWRVVTHPKVLWRSVVLASGGVTLCWGLAMTLWLDDINYSRTYRDVAIKLAEAMPRAASDGHACVSSDDLGLAQRASFAYFAHVHFARIGFNGVAEEDDCPYLLLQDLAREPRTGHLPRGHWQVIWEGRRVSDRDERYRLFRRIKEKGKNADVR